MACDAMNYGYGLGVRQSYMKDVTPQNRTENLQEYPSTQPLYLELIANPEEDDDDARDS